MVKAPITADLQGGPYRPASFSASWILLPRGAKQKARSITLRAFLIFRVSLAARYRTAATARARIGTVATFSPAMLIRESLTM